MARTAIVLLKYVVPLERIQQSTDAHRAYLRELHGQGKLLTSGPFEPRTGGCLIFRVEDEAELHAILQKDPFHREGLVEDDIRFWAPNIGALAP